MATQCSGWFEPEPGNPKGKWLYHVRIVDERVDFHFTVNLNKTTRKGISEFIEEHEGSFTGDGAALFKGALSRVVLKDEKKEYPGSLATQLPGIFNTVKHPVSGHTVTIYHAIMSLNDSHKWSRERIADWIETLDEVPVFEAQEQAQKCMVILDGWEGYQNTPTVVSKKQRILQVEYCRIF
jgi:hypothetical protein